MAERAAIHVPHDEEHESCHVPYRVDGHDVGMRERRHYASLALEPLDKFRIPEAGGKDLARHASDERDVVGQKPGSHSAGPDQASNLELAIQDIAEIVL